MEVWQTSNLWRLRLGEEKKKDRKKKKPQGKDIISASAMQGGHKKERHGHKVPRRYLRFNSHVASWTSADSPSVLFLCVFLKRTFRRRFLMGQMSFLSGCQPTNSVKALKVNERNDPNLWPGLILFFIHHWISDEKCCSPGLFLVCSSTQKCSSK